MSTFAKLSVLLAIFASIQTAVASTKESQGKFDLTLISALIDDIEVEICSSPYGDIYAPKNTSLFPSQDQFGRFFFNPFDLLPFDVPCIFGLIGDCSSGTPPDTPSIPESSSIPEFLSIPEIPSDPEPPSSCPCVYTVAAGDWLSTIASKCGTTVPAITAANPDITNPDQIPAGQQINIPNCGAGRKLLQSRTVSPCCEEYAIQDGDTLIGIADEFSVDVTAVVQYNRLSNSSQKLKTGTVIQIPCYTSFVAAVYAAAANKTDDRQSTGDINLEAIVAAVPTLDVVACKGPLGTMYIPQNSTLFPSSPDDDSFGRCGPWCLGIFGGAAGNMLSGFFSPIVDGLSDLFFGRRKLLSTELSSTLEPCCEGHTVVSGDTLVSVSEEYGADVETLMAFNGYSKLSDKLKVGTVVQLPCQNSYNAAILQMAINATRT